MAKTTLTLSRGRQGGEFRRTVLLGKKKEPKLLEFSKDHPTSVTAEELELLTPDLKPDCLLVAGKPGKDGKVRGDWDATRELLGIPDEPEETSEEPVSPVEEPAEAAAPNSE